MLTEAIEAKLREYLRVRPTAADEQLRQYIVFHCGVPMNDALATVRAYRERVTPAPQKRKRKGSGT